MCLPVCLTYWLSPSLGSCVIVPLSPLRALCMSESNSVSWLSLHFSKLSHPRSAIRGRASLRMLCLSQDVPLLRNLKSNTCSLLPWRQVEKRLESGSEALLMRGFIFSGGTDRWCCDFSVCFQFYRSLNIRIALVGLEVWTHGNMCEVSENPYSTLWSFSELEAQAAHPEEPWQRAVNHVNSFFHVCCLALGCKAPAPQCVCCLLLSPQCWQLAGLSYPDSPFQ